MDMDGLGTYIDGRFGSGSSGQTLLDHSPSRRSDVIATFTMASKADTEQAIASAVRAFPGWAHTPAPERGLILERAHRCFTDHLDELTQLLSREEGKTLKEARGEMIRGLNVLRFCSGETWRLGGETTPSELRGNLLYTLRMPVGPVGIITPWNFPFAIPIWKIAPALAAGCTVVFKPASLTPQMAVRICEIFAAAGLPPGVLNMVIGRGGDVGDTIVRSAGLRALSFTGSSDTGRDLYSLAAKTLKKVTLELGGKNAAVVLKDADLDVAARGIADGAFGSSGQRCTATARVIVERSVAAALRERLVAHAQALRIGDACAAETTMGPLVDATQLERSLHYVALAQREGATLAAGGERLHGPGLDDGYFMAPTIFTGVRPEMALAREEVFGPVLAMLEVDSLEEAIAAANAVEYGLTASIYSRDITAVQTFIDEADVGMVHVNSPTVGGEAHVPFGGTKASGVGDREMASDGVRFFTDTKTVFLDYTGGARGGSNY